MSQLPKGTKAARDFAESVTIKGAMASLIAWAPFLGWLVIRDLVEAVLEHVLLDPAFDELTAYAIAVKFVIDRKGFDHHFLILKMLDHVSPEEQEVAIVEAEKAMATFFRRGPVN